MRDKERKTIQIECTIVSTGAFVAEDSPCSGVKDRKIGLRLCKVLRSRRSGAMQ